MNITRIPVLLDALLAGAAGSALAGNRIFDTPREAYRYDPFGSLNQRRHPPKPKINPNREKQRAAKKARKITKRGR